MDDEFTAHPGHALALHCFTDLVYSLRLLQIYIYAIDGVEGVGRAVVPPDVESGPGIRDQLQMVFSEWHCGALLSSFLGLGPVSFPACFPLEVCCRLGLAVNILGDVGVTLPVVLVGSCGHLCRAGSGHAARDGHVVR